MLDITLIRKDKESIIELLSKRGGDYRDQIEAIKGKDAEWRQGISEVEELKNRKNEASKEIGRLKQEGAAASNQIEEMKTIADSIKSHDDKNRNLKSAVDEMSLIIPNLPDEKTGRKDTVIRETGSKPTFGFKPAAHWEIGEILKIMDLKTAAKLSGSRFAMLCGEGSRLERALIGFMLDIHIGKHGYTEIMPPYLVREEIMVGTGQLPKFREEMYITKEDNLCLIPTAEVPLANICREEILSPEDLPKKYVAYTPCFRREAGSYGKDTSGLIRQHQFNKVELVNIVVPEESEMFHEQLLAESEEILKQLELTYRVIELGTEELGFSASRTYDLEVWMPGEEKWREVSSCSNCRDFQARRMMTRYRTESGTKYVHTLNSSGLAVGRIFAAVLENFQTEEMNVTIPEVLRKYMNGKESIERQ
ncbi:MAG: serine--tRNA ligase [Elusimicrobiota bacterium]